MSSCCFSAPLAVLGKCSRPLSDHNNDQLCSFAFVSAAKVTANSNSAELIATVKRGPFATPTAEERLHYPLSRIRTSRVPVEQYSVLHVLSYQRRLAFLKHVFFARGVSTPLGELIDWWDSLTLILERTPARAIVSFSVAVFHCIVQRSVYACGITFGPSCPRNRSPTARSSSQPYSMLDEAA